MLLVSWCDLLDVFNAATSDDASIKYSRALLLDVSRYCESILDMPQVVIFWAATHSLFLQSGIALQILDY